MTLHTRSSSSSAFSDVCHAIAQMPPKNKNTELSSAIWGQWAGVSISGEALIPG